MWIIYLDCLVCEVALTADIIAGVTITFASIYPETDTTFFLNAIKSRFRLVLQGASVLE